MNINKRLPQIEHAARVCRVMIGTDVEVTLIVRPCADKPQDEMIIVGYGDPRAACLAAIQRIDSQRKADHPAPTSGAGEN